jgi:hypothetical protein
MEPSRIRRFNGWKDFALFLAEILGASAIICGFIGLLFTSLGFKLSGAGDAIADIRAADVARDTAIVQLKRQNDVFGSKLDDIAYLVCEQTKRNQPGLILPRSCK